MCELFDCVSQLRGCGCDDLSSVFRLRHRLGKEKFPLVNQYYYPSGDMMMISPGCNPMVLKVVFPLIFVHEVHTV